MSSVENRIVSIKFDNAQFEQNVAQTMATLEKLSQKLATVGAGKGFADINKAADSVNLDSMSSGIDKIASKFDALGAIGFTAIQSITTSVLGFVKQFAQTDILGPIISGGKDRALEIQQAEFQFQGLGINTQEVMQNALDAVKGTAFGLGDAAKAAAQFGASGISAGADMETSLRAIAGTAALTGTQFNDMAVLFTQSAATGKVDNQDLQQFATRGFNAAAAFAKQTGTTEAAVHDMASKGTLDYKTFAAAMDAAFGDHATAANQTYTGSLDNMHAAMSRLGAAFISPELDQQRDLFNALTPVIDNVTTALKPLMFTLLGIKGSLTHGLIDELSHIDLSGITSFVTPNLAQGLQNIFDTVKQFVGAIKTAFTDIFPASLTSNLTLFAEAFARITESIKIGGPTLDKITSIFRGFFSILDIGIAIIKGIATVIGDLLKAILPAGSGLLNLGASTGDFLTKMDQVLVKGGKIQDFFSKLGEILAKPIAFISDLAQKLVAFFSIGFGHDVISDVFGRIGDRVDQAQQGVQQFESVWDRLVDKLQPVINVLDKIGDAFKDFFTQLGQKIKDELKPADFNSALDAINVGLLGGITLMLKKFFAGGVKFGLGGGVFGQVKASLNQVTKSLQLMQTNLKASALLKIAGALAILTASIVALSLINSGDLTKALTAMTAGFAQLAAMLLFLNKNILDVAAAGKLALLSVALIGLATAMGIFSIAIKNLASLSLGELAKGLVGVGGGMAILVTGMNAITEDTAGLVRAGISMGIIAGALFLLSKAVESFGTMSWGEIGKGLVGIAAGLALVTLALNFMPPESVLGGLGFIELAVALNLLAGVVEKFGNMSWTVIGKGLLGMAGALTAIALAMNLVPPDIPITAAGILILSVAMETMASVIKRIGSIPFGEMVKGIAGLAATLLILVVAVNAMDGSIVGAASLLVVSVALEVLADVLKKLGSLSIEQIAIGLGAMAATFLLLGLAGALLEPVIPAILGLGLAVAAVGVGFALFGTGAFLVATALQLLATSGVAGVTAFVKSLDVLLQAIPDLAAGAALLVEQFVKHILDALPVLIKVISAILDQLLDTIIKEAPKLAEAIQVIFLNALDLIQNTFPQFLAVGIGILEAILDGLGQNADDIVTAAVTMITNFSQAILDHAEDLGAAAANLITAFVEVIGDSEDAIVEAAAGVIAGFIGAIGEGVGQIVAAAANIIIAFITEIGNHVGDIITAGANMLINLLLGITNNLVNIVGVVGQMIITFVTAIANEELSIISAGVNLIIAFMFGIAQQALKLVDAAGNCILQFLIGLDAAVKKYEPAIIAETIQIGVDIIGGIFKGLTQDAGFGGIVGFIHGLGQDVINWAGDIKNWVQTIGSDIVHGIWQGISASAGWLEQQIASFVKNHITGFFKSVLGIGSPSKVMAKIAEDIPTGIVLGISRKASLVTDSITGLASSLVGSFKASVGADPITKSITDLISTAVDMVDTNPTITPVLDLSKVANQSGSIGQLLDTQITPVVSTGQAQAIAAARSGALTPGEIAQASSGPSEISFNQVINSPTALSTNQIYRATRSQITLAKEELSIP